MDKIAVVYKSKYGSTKKYAQWIADDAKAVLYECSQVDINKLMEYDTIIYGGGLYASGIAGVSIITKNYNLIKDKSIIVFTVGLADPENKEIFTNVIEKNFPSEEMRKSIKFFHLRGGIDYKRLGIIHKSMMAMLKIMLSKKDASELSNEDKELLATYGGKVDFTDRTTIKPLITFLMDKN